MIIRPTPMNLLTWASCTKSAICRYRLSFASDDSGISERIKLCFSCCCCCFKKFKAMDKELTSQLYESSIMEQLCMPFLSSKRISTACKRPIFSKIVSVDRPKANNVAQQQLAFSTAAASVNGILICCGCF